ncbi:MAG: NAD-dependent epimerase/dehydratase family protein [Actinomycetes bacterium]|jgi:UDP-glucose 4-epimerase|nr:NAD-dependent epimerase/dehydratase family protein [Actinomycetes bacterium]
MKILVTGGAGFIGTNLVTHLLALDGEVMVVDDLSTGRAENIDPRSLFRHMDICDDDFVQAVVDWQPQVIVHLAAQSSVARAERKPKLTRRVNVEGTRAVTRAAIAAGCERVVFASSAAVYGNPARDALPLVETYPASPINLYGETKLLGEELLACELREAEVDYAIARFSNVYGPRQDGGGEGGVVAQFCRALACGQTPVIYGDGTASRDFVYVGDVVAALVSMIGGDLWFCERADAPAAGIYNISSGWPVSVRQLSQALQRISGQFEDFDLQPARPGDIEHSALSAAKALASFEWKATVEMEVGLRKTYDWFVAHTPV